MSTRYVIKSGDNLSKIAATFGLKSWNEIYNNSENADFRRRRPNPNVIFPGDVLMVPDKPGTFNHVLPEPTYVEQDNTWWCWAAAMESWLLVTDGREAATQEVLRNTKFAAFTDPLTGGLTPAGWGKVASEYNMEARMFSDNSAHGALQPSAISPQLIHDTLKNKGFIVVVYNLSPGGAAHTNVIYGIKTVGTETFLLVMDPKQNGGGLLTRPLSHYTSREFVGLLWAR